MQGGVGRIQDPVENGAFSRHNGGHQDIIGLTHMNDRSFRARSTSGPMWDSKFSEGTRCKTDADMAWQSDSDQLPRQVIRSGGFRSDTHGAIAR